MLNFKQIFKYLSEKELIDANIYFDQIFISTFFFLIFRDSILNFKIITFYFLLLICLINFLFTRFGFYSSYRYKSLYNLANKIFTGWSATFSIFITTYLFINQNYLFESLKFISWYCISLLYLFLVHLILRKIIRGLQAKGFKNKKVIYYGKEKDIKNFELIIKKNKWLGHEIIGIFGEENINKFKDKKQSPYLGGLNQLKIFIENNTIDEIYFSHDSSYKVSIEELLDIFGNTSLHVIYIPSWTSGGMVLKPVELGDDKLALEIWGVERSYVNIFKKRLFDYILAQIFLIILSPIFIIIGICIKLNSKGPIFFKQYRSGLNGKKFLIYKFRTMYINDCGGKLIQAKINDKRVTSLGRFLRKWSLDELPQLINVLKGEMSLVGPRPHAVEHNQIYRKMIRGYMQRHASIPGLTGLAQIQGLRGETSDISKMEARINADLKYRSQWSIFLDIKILIKTIINIKSSAAF